MLGRSSDLSHSTMPSQGFAPVTIRCRRVCTPYGYAYEIHSSGNCPGFPPDSLLISSRRTIAVAKIRKNYDLQKQNIIFKWKVKGENWKVWCLRRWVNMSYYVFRWVTMSALILPHITSSKPILTLPYFSLFTYHLSLNKKVPRSPEALRII